MNELPAHLYPLCDVAVITKRHVHDVRNALNGIELELTLLEGTAKDADSCEAVSRLRNAVSETGRLMQRMASRHATQAMSPVAALQIAEQWRMDARHVVPDAPLEWNIRLTTESVCVEPGLIRSLLADMLQTAVSMGGRKMLHITCSGEAERVVFDIGLGVGTGIAGMIDAQQSYWTALRRLAERNQGTMEPEQLSPPGFPLRLMLPVQRPPA